jgi:2-oxo-4-hydroxy-4-carboxy-5-ureidoimidazoline decarboxylase
MALTASRRVSADPGLSWLDELAAPDARAVLWDCCRSARWVERMEALRPYRTRGRLVDLADVVTRRLEWIEVRQALASFPRLGDAGHEGGYQESWTHRESWARLNTWTRQEVWARQEREAFAASGFEEEPLARAVALGAREYEERFGYVFVICGQGRTAHQTLAALSTRLNNEPRTERLVVRAELAAIARIRLVKLLASPPMRAMATAGAPTRTTPGTTMTAVRTAAVKVPAQLPVSAPVPVTARS